MFPKQCIHCRGPLVDSKQVLERQVAGRTFTSTVPVMACPKCDEVYIGSDDGKKFSLAIAEDLALNGPPSGEAFRFMRKALGMPAVAIASLLGLRPETVSRWEKGKQTADPRSVVLLGSVVLDSLNDESRTFDRLQQQLCA